MKLLIQPQSEGCAIVVGQWKNVEMFHVSEVTLSQRMINNRVLVIVS